MVRIVPFLWFIIWCRSNLGGNPMVRLKLLSIDAWRDECGWTWNNAFIIEDGIYMDEDLITPRKIARRLREWGYLSDYSRGRIRVDMHPEYDAWFIEILDKSTREPIFALSTIH